MHATCSVFVYYLYMTSCLTLTWHFYKYKSSYGTPIDHNIKPIITLGIRD